MSDQDATDHSTPEAEAARRRARLRQAGFTLTEMIVAVYIVGLLSAIVSTGFVDKREKARLARCMVEMRGIQSAIYTYSPDGMSTASTKRTPASPGKTYKKRTSGSRSSASMTTGHSVPMSMSPMSARRRSPPRTTTPTTSALSNGSSADPAAGGDKPPKK